VECPFLLWCKALDPSLSCLSPLMGSQHPFDGLFNTIEVPTDHLPMCTGPKWYLSVGHDPAHQQLHPPWAHQSQGSWQCQSHLIIKNTCIKSLIHQSKAQRHYTSLQYKFGENDKASYWASVHWKRKVLRRDLIQAM
jgi:hypothetical protein